MAGPDQEGDLRIEAEIGRDPWLRRVRVGGSSGPRYGILVEDPALAAVLQDQARSYAAVRAPGLVPIVRGVRRGNGLLLLLGGEPGSRRLTEAPCGEAAARLEARRVALALAAMFQRNLAHGSLCPDGIATGSDGALQILPPVALRAHAAAIAGAAIDASEAPPGRADLKSPAARDLADLAWFLCARTNGSAPSAAAGADACPATLRSAASPATVNAVRNLLVEAVAEPGPAAALAVLDRLGLTRPLPVERPATLRPPAAPGALQDEPPRSARVPRRALRVPAVVGVIAAGAVIGAALVFGGGDAARDFWSGRRSAAVPVAPPAPPAPAPTPTMEPAAEPAPPPAAASAVAPAPEAAAPPAEDPAALAERLIEQLKAERAARAPVPAKPSFDRTLLDQADAVVKEAKDLLRKVRDREVPHADRNRVLDQALDKLDSAREKYESFAKQNPSRARLVESSLEDVASLAYFAHKSKTRE